MDIAFADGDSFIHRLDPRARILAAFSLSTILAVSDRPAATALGLIVALALVGLARLKPSRLLWHVAAVNAFLLILWAILPVATPGEIVARLGPLAVTREGLLAAFTITLKSNAILLTCISLLATMDVVRLGHALHHLGAPDKLIHVFLFTVRYFDILHREYHRLAAAMKVRCFRPRTNRHTYRSYGQLVGMLLVRSFDRSERVMAAMKCRGFKGEFFVLRHFVLTAHDLGFACAACLLLLLLACAQWPGIFLRQ